MRAFRLPILAATVACGLFPSVALGGKQAKLAEGFAEITFVKGYAKAFGTGASQIYSSSQNGECKAVTGQALFHFLAGKRKKKIIKSGESITIFSAINYVNSNFQNEFGSGACMNKLDFTPKSLGRYQIIQTSDARRCELSITDLETGTVLRQTEAMNPRTCQK
jgi:hypothetical protein